jgi:hypothetical protein
VVHAQSPKAQGESAAFAILAWDQGEFEFRPSPGQATRSITRSTLDLVMEGARVADSRVRLQGIYPNPNLVPWPTLPTSRLASNLEIAAKDLPVLTFLDGFHSFDEVIAASGLPEVNVLQVCATLQDAGRLVVLNPAISVVAVPDLDGTPNGPCLLSKGHEAHWRVMGPYRARPIENVRLSLGTGTPVVAVRFRRGVSDREVAVPVGLMKAHGIQKGSKISIRPDSLLASDNSLTLMPLGE